MRFFFAKSALVVVWFVVGMMAGCGSTNRAAPVEDRTQARERTTAVQREARSTSKAVVKETSPASATASASSKRQPPAETRTATSSTQRPPAETGPATSSTQPVSTPPTPRPIVEATEEGDWRPDYYTVRKGDTLYSIALDFGQDYRDIAEWNKLANAAYIQVGQRLRVSAPQGENTAVAAEPLALPPATLPGSDDVAEKPKDVPTFTDPMAYRSDYSEQAFNDLQRQLTGEVETTVIAARPAPEPPRTAVTPKPAAKPPQSPTKSTTANVTTPDGRLHWEWPASGDLLYAFTNGRKGIAIRGQSGQAVVSSAPGKVVYSGSGLRGYGNLIIVKHNATYLSVYAHNRQLLVSEGQMVAQGQKIGVMGEISPGEPGLHFEIRRLGKPVDPLELLPSRPS